MKGKKKMKAEERKNRKARKNTNSQKIQEALNYMLNRIQEKIVIVNKYEMITAEQKGLQAKVSKEIADSMYLEIGILTGEFDAIKKLLS